MKIILKLFTCIASLTLTQLVMAECPTSLSAEQMQDCIVTENSGYYYNPRGKTNAVDEQTNEPVAASEDDSGDSKKNVAATRDNISK